jgi:hypothetical protein
LKISLPVGKLVSGIILVTLALPKLDWTTSMEMLFSVTWLLFASFYVVANWRAWRQAGMMVKLQKEYRWRLEWLLRKRRKNRLERSY